jgi:phosphoribosylanthranilate isomerase
MKPIVKICGITEEETLRSIAEEGLSIDQLGFVFAPSRREVSPREWGSLASALPAQTKAAGVFVNPTLERIAQVFDYAPLDIVQLHGEETPEFCQDVRRRFGCAVTKVFSIRAEDDKEDSRLDAYAGAVDYVLLDTACGAQTGGTGKTFDWQRIPPYQMWSRRYGIPLLVAGGLHADNVTELLMRYTPDGVDISSGAETDGRKDMKKIRVIIERMSQEWE